MKKGIERNEESALVGAFEVQVLEMLFWMEVVHQGVGLHTLELSLGEGL